MGRVPARCVVLLEDLDAAFTRSTSRDDSGFDDDKDKDKKEGENGDKSIGPSRSSRRRDQLSDVNTLSLSGLLNALDGVAAAEGRLLFATTNHLERLDPALSRPGRMDVWIEFRNASKWQAEALFRNFFPCAEDEVLIDESELEGVEIPVEVNEGPKTPSKAYVATPTPSSPTSTNTDLSPSPSTSGVSSLWSLASSASSLLNGSPADQTLPPTAKTEASKPPLLKALPAQAQNGFNGSEQFGASNTAYRPPPPAESVLNSRHSAAPLDKKTLNDLAKKFADGLPEEEFSVAALQGCEFYYYDYYN